MSRRSWAPVVAVLVACGGAPSEPSGAATTAAGRTEPAGAPASITAGSSAAVCADVDDSATVASEGTLHVRFSGGGCFCGDRTACDVSVAPGVVTLRPALIEAGSCDACLDLDVACALPTLAPGEYVLDVAGVRGLMRWRLGGADRHATRSERCVPLPAAPPVAGPARGAQGRQG